MSVVFVGRSAVIWQFVGHFVGRSAVIWQSVRLSQLCAWVGAPRPPPTGGAQWVLWQSERLRKSIFCRFCFAMLFFVFKFVALDGALVALWAVAGGRSPTSGAPRPPPRGAHAMGVATFFANIGANKITDLLTLKNYNYGKR